MLTEQDERRGIVKVYWSTIRERVAKVECEFTKLVDALAPDKSFPLYLAYYPYGAVDADTESSIFPDQQGNFFRLSDPNISKDLLKHLGYSINNTPLGMVLEKQIECFIDLKSTGITIPSYIYTPGKIFPFTRILNKRSNRIYAPYGLLSSTAGARSAFVLPNIGCATHHSNLIRDFNIQNPAPKSLYNHWQVFKEIINSPIVNSAWRCCVMYFSEQWIEKIYNDKAWADLKQYLHELAWHQCEYEINRIHYDMIFSIIQQNKNLKPNPYLADTAKHLFATAIGAAPGFIPALSEDALPLQELQKIFIESYGLKKYIPTIMHPRHFKFEDDRQPIYYSLQNPSTHVFSPKSRVVSSTLHEMRELEHIMKVFTTELAKENSMCSANSIISKIAKGTKFLYYHSKTDSHKVIRPSSEIKDNDDRFMNYSCPSSNATATFASDAPFVRGCISISTQN